MSSPAEAKQMEPEGKPTSQVRLEWKQSGEQGWVLNLDTLRLSVEPSDEGLDWSALVEAPWGADFVQYCDSLEGAKEYCEEKAKELLKKDLKSLGGGVQAEPAEVTP